MDMVVKDKTVYLVDDDAAVQITLKRALTERGFVVEQFDSAQSFISHYTDSEPGCLVLDLRMPEINGLTLQELLRRQHITLPIIFITGHGGVPEAVKALRAGAVDFLEKPIRIDELTTSILRAFELDSQLREKSRHNQSIQSRFQKLTSREREVMEIMVTKPSQASSKEIARKLGISHRTVEVHRARVFEKTQVGSVSELANLAKTSGFLALELDYHAPDQ